MTQATTKTPTIEPTVGRVVHIRGREGSISGDQPEVALITYVHSVFCINVAGFDANGEPFRMSSLALIQDPDIYLPEGVPHAEWMAYQRGQAAKYDALEQKLAGAGDPESPPKG